MTVRELMQTADNAPSMFEDELVTAWHGHTEYLRWIAHLVGLGMMRWDADRREYWTNMGQGDDFKVEREDLWTIQLARPSRELLSLLKHEAQA